MFFFVKLKSLAAGSEEQAAQLLRRTITETHAALPILSIRSFEQHLESDMQLWSVRAGAAMFSVFGVLALGLAVYLRAQRQRLAELEQRLAHHEQERHEG